MKATFIGTGTAFSRRYGHTNVLVEHRDTHLMIDFGFTAPARLNGLNRSLKEITHVAVSHIHADHVGGLEELAFMSRFVFGRKPTLVLPSGLADDLWNRCLRGGLEQTSDEQGRPLRCTLESYFDVIRLGDEWSTCGQLSIKAFANDHVPDKATYGFVVRDAESGHQMIFGCDCRSLIGQLTTEPTPEDFARGPVFHDCQLFDDGTSGVHIHFKKLLEYPASVRKRLVLVHYNDSILNHLPAVYEAGFNLAWPGDVIQAAQWRESLQQNHQASPTLDGGF